ncbi:MAG TPA: AAA family ATPase [Thermoanaerobaculia bacterium]|nr:AAA family ATPase [Thermoanaerobaculia bacterium]
MRIAVSGTHCSGKSTLIEDFLTAHREYLHEPEPYEWLQELYGEASPQEPGIDDFYRQLELSVERLRTYERGASVIAERSPVDFLAYILAVIDLGREGRDCAAVASAAELAATGLASVDLMVVLPLIDQDRIVVPEAEDVELREAMNDRLLDLVAVDEYSLFASGKPRVIEIHGTRSQRLRQLEQAMH